MIETAGLSRQSFPGKIDHAAISGSLNLRQDRWKLFWLLGFNLTDSQEGFAIAMEESMHLAKSARPVRRYELIGAMGRMAHWVAPVAFFFAAFPIGLAAQQHLEVARGDGRSTPLLVYAPSPLPSQCPPVAIISHGAGGSENGYRYLAKALSGMGFRTIAMGHRESGMAALTGKMREAGIHDGISGLVGDPQAEEDRLLDVGAALKWADAQCQASFRVLLGHSMGAETTMLEAGAHNRLGIASPPSSQDRFDAYIALSPEGPGMVFPDHAWDAIHKPILILTGTRDQALQGGPRSRQIPWSVLPGSQEHCQWMGVIDGATHMNFAGAGIGHLTVEPVVSSMIASFLAGVRGQECLAPPSIPGTIVTIK